MRISTDRSDRGYAPDYQFDLVVYFNGSADPSAVIDGEERKLFVITADDELHEITAVVGRPGGIGGFEMCGRQPRTVKLTGRVEIRRLHRDLPMRAITTETR